ncbi:protein lap1 isoform X2 [Venturia canescens]|uniref:protein lap1 isoform X2 n=1 Tax=Venturia canescens TaxID=32260 RepID=UPI001C9D6350|nr:protein lap1-like isoform X2 [Venturia canescens]
MGSSWWQCTACLRAQEEDICELQLNHCNLYDVPPDVFIYERTLEKLYLDANRIKDLPRPLFQCHELRVLSLSDNEITNLPPAIASLINLEHLDLSKNSIKELPDSIKECKNLRSIDISVNPFERFPDAITYIVGLRELYINDAYIEYLPANFGRLSALRTLELRENNMMTLPKSMSRLVNLQRLDIGNNDFTELPEVVGDLTNLTELWIDGNDIRRIPVNIEQLYRLNHFDCTMNAVHLVPAEIQGWRDISIMNFSSNEIYQLPDSLCYLRTIVTLKIDDNQLNSLPVDIGQMSNLEELIVTKNFLEYLPSSIGLLRKLHCLNADNNYLRSLPPEIGSCTALSLLSLRSNNLSSVPPELGHLSSLRVLNLVNNCIQFLPVSMLNLTNLKALWLSDNQSQPLVPLQQEFNTEEDMMVLSCFMLPQKQRQELELEQAVGPISGSIVGTGRRICFAAEVETEVPRQLHRAPTPYPKELRNLARHARNLQHQTAHDQRVQAERETLIKEAVVAKATSVLGVASITGTCPAQTKSNKNSSYISSTTGEKQSEKINSANGSVSRDKRFDKNEDTNEEGKCTVIAKEMSPEIREAKCVRNPTSDCLARTPTIADYVNSTWKPEEYSKTNTAKIVESEKLAEPYKNTSFNTRISDRSSLPTGKTNEVPPAPPPYHIAAAFSKKAALFQQFNHALRSNNSSSPLPTVCTNHEVASPQHLQNSSKTPEKLEKSLHPGSINERENESQNSLANGDVPGRGDTHEAKDRARGNAALETSPNITENHLEGDRLGLKPSRIPIFRTKNPEGSNLEIDSPEKYASGEDFERLRLDPSEIPTSPVTGKKYRSPLSLQTRLSDRSLKRQTNNGNFSLEETNCRGSPNGSFESCNNGSGLKTPGKDTRRDDNIESTNSHSFSSTFANNCFVDELNSNNLERNNASVMNSSYETSNDLDSIDTNKYDHDDNDNPDRRPRHRWMFGPHKNVNVLSVQVRKNPGLGFSIAGGIAGAETGIIVTKVNPDGPAQGTLRPGDKILEVDGIDFTKSDHNTAVAVLRSTGAIVSMLISRHQ